MSKGNTWCKQKMAKLRKQQAAARDYRRQTAPREVVTSEVTMGPFPKASDYQHTVALPAHASGLESDIGVMGSKRAKRYTDGCTRHKMLMSKPRFFAKLPTANSNWTLYRPV
jgi:hypothetical protein